MVDRNMHARHQAEAQRIEAESRALYARQAEIRREQERMDRQKQAEAMAEYASPKARTARLVDRALENLESAKVLAPGARQELQQRIIEAKGGPSESVEMLAELLNNPRTARRYRDPSATRSKSILRELLDFLPIDKAGREAMERRLMLDANEASDIGAILDDEERSWASQGLAYDRKAREMEAKGKAASRIAGMLMEAMEERDSRDYWSNLGKFAPPLPAAEVRCRALLEDFRPYLRSGVDLDALARDPNWMHHVGGLGVTAGEGRKRIAARLGTQFWAGELAEDGQPLKFSFDYLRDMEGEVDREEQEQMSAMAAELNQLHGADYYQPM